MSSSSKEKSAEAAFEPDSPIKLLASGLSSFKDPVGFLKRSDNFTLLADDVHLKSDKTKDVFNTVLISNFQVKKIFLVLFLSVVSFVDLISLRVGLPSATTLTW